jgi:hypothetical protein
VKYVELQRAGTRFPYFFQAGMDFTGSSPGWNGFYWRFTGLLRNEESSPGWNGFYGSFTGLEWNLLEIHRAGMEFTGESPGCYETRKVHRAGMDFTGDSPGWNGFDWRFTGLE